MAEKILLIGWGAIAHSVTRLLKAHGDVGTDLIGVLVHDAKVQAQKDPDFAHLFVDRLEDGMARAPSLVVECAGHGAVDSYAQTVLRAGTPLLLVSIGALADDERLNQLVSAARSGSTQLLLASGAVGGLDWLCAARTAGLQSVLYRGRKPPLAWAGTQAEARCDLAALTAPTLIFSGSAREAAQRFPKNANVAATVAFSSLGLNATRVELYADPAVRENQHEIEAESAAGSLRLTLSGLPESDNPRTSMITAHSVVHAILRRSAAVAL